MVVFVVVAIHFLQGATGDIDPLPLDLAWPSGDTSAPRISFASTGHVWPAIGLTRTDLK
jgi:hypothetical protein